MRKIQLKKIAKEPTNRLQKVANLQSTSFPEKGYFASYEENVFPAARAALTSGKFHDMFTA